MKPKTCASQSTAERRVCDLGRTSRGPRLAAPTARAFAEPVRLSDTLLAAWVRERMPRGTRRRDALSCVRGRPFRSTWAPPAGRDCQKPVRRSDRFSRPEARAQELVRLSDKIGPHAARAFEPVRQSDRFSQPGARARERVRLSDRFFRPAPEGAPSDLATRTVGPARRCQPPVVGWRC